MRKPPVKVLVVDPGEEVQALLQEILERCGHSVTLASNGQEAQKSILREGGDFNLVITSHEMPLLNGVQLILWIKKRHSFIRTILIEDCTKEEICEAARAAGADEVLEKPFDFNLLSPIIEKMRMTETRRSLRILVVDDTESMRLILTAALTHDGHSVGVTTNGQEALKMLSQDPGYDLVITDYEMEPLHGLELTQRIKKEYPHMKIIFMTGFCDEIFSAALAAGACGTLRKPFSPALLTSAIEKACAGQTKQTLAR